MVATAETMAAEPGARASGRMVIEIRKDRRVIVDAGVDAAALARVLANLERR
jgi:transposase